MPPCGPTLDGGGRTKQQQQQAASEGPDTWKEKSGEIRGPPRFFGKWGTGLLPRPSAVLNPGRAGGERGSPWQLNSVVKNVRHEKSELWQLKSRSQKRATVPTSGLNICSELDSFINVLKQWFKNNKILRQAALSSRPFSFSREAIKKKKVVNGLSPASHTQISRD